MDPGGQEDPSLLVVVRQSLIFTFLLLGICAACLSRHGSAVHLWLEGSWWLVATSLGVVLFIQGIFQLITQDKDTPDNVRFLQLLEEAELGLYLVLATFANIGRKRAGRRYRFLRMAFWIATIFLVILWSVSSLINIVTTGRATPGTIITMTATVVTGVIMLADLCVTSWHDMDAAGITEEQAQEELHEPLAASEEGVHAASLSPKGPGNGYSQPQDSEVSFKEPLLPDSRSGPRPADLLV